MDRLTTLFEQTFERASRNGGIWLNQEGKKSPAFYQKGVQISPFNAVILGLHSDQNNYKTNLYTLFSEAKKIGESVQTKERARDSRDWGECCFLREEFRASHRSCGNQDRRRKGLGKVRGSGLDWPMGGSGVNPAPKSCLSVARNRCSL